MRASVDKDDPGYLTWVHNRKLRVFFEGAEVKHVRTADEEQRFILQYDLNDKGQMYVAKDGSGATVTRYGHVRIDLGEA